jgi:hypothetical protein
MRKTTHLSFLVSALFLSPFASADVVSSDSTGFHIKQAHRYEDGATNAYRVFVDDIDSWWPVDHTWFGADGTLTVDPVAGGCFCEIAGDKQAQHMTVAYVDPGRVLRLTGGLGPLQGLGLNGTMTLTFSDSELTLEYIVSGYPSVDLTQLAPVVDKVLSLQMSSFTEFTSQE